METKPTQLTVAQFNNLSLPEAALWYADHDIAIFPCWPYGKNHLETGESLAKAPHGILAPNGVYAATCDSKKIKEWWLREPNANIGIPAGLINGITVVDLDRHDPEKNGVEKFTELEQANGCIKPQPLFQKTGGGGIQLFFRHNPRIKNAVGKRGTGFDGIDFKNGGGYVVAPPSRHPSGNLYQWSNGALTTVAELPELPDWLINKSVQQNKGPFDLPESIGKQERNSTLAQLGGWLRNVGFTVDETCEIIRMVNDNRCYQPLDEGELEATIFRSVERWEPTRTFIPQVPTVKDTNKLKENDDWFSRWLHRWSLTECCTRKQNGNVYQYDFPVCPSERHTEPSYTRVIVSDGPFLFFCEHPECAGMRWKEFRTVVEQLRGEFIYGKQ